MSAYAEAYRATGGMITTLSFVAALVSWPACMNQVVSVHRPNPGTSRVRSELGLAEYAASNVGVGRRTGDSARPFHVSEVRTPF